MVTGPGDPCDPDTGDHGLGAGLAEIRVSEFPEELRVRSVRSGGGGRVRHIEAEVARTARTEARDHHRGPLVGRLGDIGAGAIPQPGLGGDRAAVHEAGQVRIVEGNQLEPVEQEARDVPEELVTRARMVVAVLGLWRGEVVSRAPVARVECVEHPVVGAGVDDSISIVVRGSKRLVAILQEEQTRRPGDHQGRRVEDVAQHDVTQLGG